MIKPEFSTYTISNIEDFNKLVRYTNQVNSQNIVLDVESNSEIEKIALLYGIGLCFNEKKAFYIVWRNKDGSETWTKEQQITISQWLEDTCSKFRLIGHNIIYDILVIENNLGINLTDYIYSDTILQKHTLEEEPPFALKEIATKELGDWADKAQDKLKENVLANGGKFVKTQKDIHLADTEILSEYCCHDVILTIMLFNIYESRLIEEDLVNLFYVDEVMPLYKHVTINMKRKGFKIDLDHFNNLKTEITQEILKLETEIMQEIKPLVANFEQELLDKDYPIKTSGLFPVKLAEHLNIPLPVSVKTGKVTLAKKAIEKQKELTPIHSDFYDSIISNSPYKLADSILQAVQRNMLLADQNRKYVFNLSSNDHLAYLICKVWKLNPQEKTETGKPKIDDDFLELVAKRKSAIKKLLDYKKLNKLLSTYVEGILERQIDGYIYASMLQFGTTSGRYSSRNPNCLSLDTEILTNKGFKKYNEINKYTEIASFDGDKIIFETPDNIYLSENNNKTIITIKNQHLNMRLTDNHRIIYFDRHNNNKMCEKPAKNFPKDARIYHGIHTLTIPQGYDLNWLRFVVACQADSEIRKDSSKIRFRFYKKRKYNRLLEILNNFKFLVEDKSKNGMYEILVSGCKDAIINIIGYEKIFPNNWVTLGSEERKTVLKEIFEWDDLSTRKCNYSSNEELNVDLIQALCVMEGWRAHKRIYKTIANNNNYELQITKRNFSLTANAEINSEISSEKVWCVSVPSSMFIARRGSDTFITGNCQNLPRIKDEDSGISEIVLKYSNQIRKGFIAPEGYKILNADYNSLEPICFAHVSGDESLRNVFRNGEDLYSRIAIDVFNLSDYSANKKDPNYLGLHEKEARQKSKAFCLAVVYGAEASRVKDILNVSWQEAHRIINDYLEAYPNLKKYMNQCNYEAKKYGFVKTEFGRVRHLKQARLTAAMYNDSEILDYKWAAKKGLEKVRREYKNLLNNAKNFKIQGLAATIINRSMIALTKAFKANNIDADILLMVHDEVTCIVREDQSEIASKIMKETMENTIKISVPLKAEPVISDNWAESK